MKKLRKGIIIAALLVGCGGSSAVEIVPGLGPPTSEATLRLLGLNDVMKATLDFTQYTDFTIYLREFMLAHATNPIDYPDLYWRSIKVNSTVGAFLFPDYYQNIVMWHGQSTMVETLQRARAGAPVGDPQRDIADQICSVMNDYGPADHC